MKIRQVSAQMRTQFGFVDELMKFFDVITNYHLHNILSIPIPNDKSIYESYTLNLKSSLKNLLLTSEMAFWRKPVGLIT